MKKVLIILGIVFILIASIIAYYYFSIFGSPIVAKIVNRDVQVFVKENYPNFNLTVDGKARYDYLACAYRVNIKGDNFNGQILTGYSKITLDSFKIMLEDQARKELTVLIDKHKNEKTDLHLSKVYNFNTKILKPNSDFKNNPLDLEILIKTLDILTNTEVKNLITAIHVDLKNTGYIVKNYTIDPWDSNLQYYTISSTAIETGNFESLNQLFYDFYRMDLQKATIKEFNSILSQHAFKQITSKLPIPNSRKVWAHVSNIPILDTSKVQSDVDLKNVPLNVTLFIDTIDTFTITDFKDSLISINTTIKNNGYIIKNYIVKPDNIPGGNLSSTDIDTENFKSLNEFFESLPS